jgi:hypothetical protein
MEPVVKTKNVGRAEAILRSIIGVILIIFAFFIEGILRWVVGLIGVVFIQHLPENPAALLRG